jgi:Domain of unknown function (DUF4262)
VNALFDERICTFGRTAMGVDDGRGRPTWAYTIGLARVGHPELVIATVGPSGRPGSSAILPSGSSPVASGSTRSTRRGAWTA